MKNGAANQGERDRDNHDEVFDANPEEGPPRCEGEKKVQLRLTLKLTGFGVPPTYFTRPGQHSPSKQVKPAEKKAINTQLLVGASISSLKHGCLVKHMNV